MNFRALVFFVVFGLQLSYQLSAMPCPHRWCMHSCLDPYGHVSFHSPLLPIFTIVLTLLVLTHLFRLFVCLCVCLLRSTYQLAIFFSDAMGPYFDLWLY
ncbi:hypothetical protein K457DRAFT_556396 [Linnemannia elongata AG-77]|uniref:Uncharacterized protein n=1 Tax=Linnemannia elongata AG-77 TaxID=1314771 RepID=A0A197JTE5_9FUNG|nr:hypothetical protein K457DRAFT_556396 [Linnemannia elongata AG-77]